MKNSLTFKICAVISALLLAASGLTYAAVAGFLPAFYSNQLEASLDTLSQEMAETLKSYGSIEKAGAALELFAASTELSVAVLDQNGNLVWPERQIAEMRIETTSEDAGATGSEDTVSMALDVSKEADDTEAAPEEGDSVTAAEAAPAEEDTVTAAEAAPLEENSMTVVEEVVVSDEAKVVGENVLEAVAEEGDESWNASAIKKYDLKLGREEYVMLVAGGMQPVNQAMEILRQIFPYILGIAVLVSVLFALAGSLYLTVPVVRLSRISRKMAALDFSDQYTGHRKDEIGELGRSLNEMASNLSGTLKNLKLANDRLRSDIELEREIEQKRIAFFSAVSHELKTPITILKGHISGMLQGVGAYQNRDYYLQRSRETTEKMEAMVSELLTVSRMESGTFVTQETDLAELMRLQLAEFTELLEERELELEAELPEHLYARVNSGMMEKVFRNFLMNAIRYTPAGNGNQIRVFLNSALEHGIFCSVENTGTHIPESALPHLFDAFYRVESSRSRKTGGSGLGLYIVRMALEQHGAGYGVENTREGVRFFFELQETAASQKTHKNYKRTPESADKIGI